jgi:hypothetical protein
MLFHPSRTAAALTATNIRLRAKDSSFEGTKAQFREWVSKIREEAVGKEPVEIDCTAEDVEQILASEVKPVEEPAPVADLTVDGMRARAKEALTAQDFGALVGPGAVRVFKKAKVSLGRASPKCRPDVDLADLNLQSMSRVHCTVWLATDLQFYVRCQGNVVIINGCIFEKGAVVRLKDRDTIDIGGACFIFFENQPLLQQLRNIK